MQLKRDPLDRRHRIHSHARERHPLTRQTSFERRHYTVERRQQCRRRLTRDGTDLDLTTRLEGHVRATGNLEARGPTRRTRLPPTGRMGMTTNERTPATS